MPFKKGNVPWIKGRKVSIEVRVKISNSLKGYKPWRYVVAGWNKGIPRTIDEKEVQRQAMLGKVSWNKGIPMSGVTKIKLGIIRKKQGAPWMKGIIFTDEHRRKLSETHRGEKSYLWRGGISSVNSLIRSSFEYRDWRKKVYERDMYFCQKCGKKGGDIQADHIKPFALFPELRFELSNGTTLCKKCHAESHRGSRSGHFIRRMAMELKI